MKQVKQGVENLQEYERQKQEFIKSLEYCCDRQRHLVCKPYSFANLHVMAADLGIKRYWFHKDHYDIPKRRIEEITGKCQVVTSKDIVKIIKKRKELDPYTFGDSEASIILAQILSQDGHEKYCKKVSTKYHEFCELMNNLYWIKDMHIRLVLSDLIIKNMEESIITMNITEEVRSFFLNITKTVYKKHVSYFKKVQKAKTKERREIDLARNEEIL